MNIGKLTKILDLMDERGIAEIEVRSWFRTVRISRAGAGANVSFISAGPVDPAVAASSGKAPAPPLPGGEAAAVAPGEAEAAEEDLIVIKSPMV